MSKRGKRGVASFQKNYKEEDYKVEFDQNNRPVSAMSSPFMSWFGLKVRQTFPYHIDTKKFDTNRWEELWLDAKVWFFLTRYGIFKPIGQKSLCLEKQRNFVQNLEAGLLSTMLIKEKDLFRNMHISILHIGMNSFRKKQAKNFWYDISEKAKASANANTNFSRLGRTGYAGLDAKADTIWPILEAKYSYLKNIQDKRAKAWIMSVLPQTQTGDVATTSCYHPGPETKEDDPNELQMPSQQNIDQMSFMNMLMRVQELPEKQMPNTLAPNSDPEFIDPKVTTALERTKTRPRAIQDMVELLSRCVGDNHSILISSPARMYPQTVQDSIPYVELLQLFSNDWLDISVIHWFAMYFYETHNSQCAFFNPHHIKGDSCTKNPEGVQEHIIDMFMFHTDKTFFLAPYLANDHWTLIVICPSTKRGYIIDSISREKDQHSYLLTSVIDEAFGFPFLWDMVNVL
ncbi:putative papain-like cysteine peptidase superfamily [Helianthus anomalus]